MTTSTTQPPPRWHDTPVDVPTDDIDDSGDDDGDGDGDDGVMVSVSIVRGRRGSCAASSFVAGCDAADDDVVAIALLRAALGAAAMHGTGLWMVLQQLLHSYQAGWQPEPPGGRHATPDPPPRPAGDAGTAP